MPHEGLLLRKSPALLGTLTAGIEDVWACRLCPAGTHLIVTSFQKTLADSTTVYRHCIYKDHQLVAMIMRPAGHRLMAASAGASVLFFVSDQESLRSNCGSIRTVRHDGTLLSEHRIDPISVPRRTDAYHMFQDGKFLALAASGVMLYVCSTDGSLQAISLDRSAVQPERFCIQASSCNGLAAVCIMGQQSEVLFVNLAQKCVVHRHDLPSTAIKYARPGEDLDLAQTSCSLAICHRDSNETRVLATDGTSAGFVLPGALRPSWDLLGRFLAVVMLPGVCVYDAKGTCLASLSMPSAVPSAVGCAELHWQPDSSELMWMSHDFQPSYCGNASSSRSLLRFR